VIMFNYDMVLTVSSQKYTHAHALIKLSQFSLKSFKTLYISQMSW